MKLIIILLSIFGFIESISYGLHEYQTNGNHTGGVAIFVLATLGLVFPILGVLI